MQSLNFAGRLLSLYIFEFEYKTSFLFLSSVSDIVQQRAASNSFEFVFHDVCSKSTHLMHFLKLTGLLNFILVNSNLNHTFCLSYCKPHRWKNGCVKSVRVWVPLCLLQVDLILCNSWDLQVVWFSYIFFEFDYKSSLVLFWVTVSDIAQQTAASNSFEFAFRDVCSKSTSFDAFPEIDRSFHFPRSFF